MPWYIKLKRFFGYYPDDWRSVWSGYAKWVDASTKEDLYAFYRIQYSYSRDLFELITEGHRATEHNAYAIALEELCKFNKDLLERIFSTKNKRINE